jgi:hypothetical protein
MLTKIIAAVIAVALLLAYVGAIAFKMKDGPLAGVILIGVVVMLLDLWYSLRKPQD